MKKCMILKSKISVLVVLLILHIFCPAGQAMLKGGCAKVNITPPLGIPLIGSAGKPSDDILDELYAKALVLNDGRITIAIVSVDLLYVPLEEITNPIRKIIKDKIGIPSQNVLICSTHTHSGPEVFTRTKLRPEKEVPASEIDQFYLQTLIRKMAGSVLIAHKNMREVKIGAAKGQISEILYNRRPKNNDGSVKMAFTLGPEVTATKKIETDAEGNVKVTFTLPDEEADLDFGPIDPEVCVLRVEDMDGGIVGSLVNFGCHPVCIYPYLNTTISADYPAYTTGVVEQMEGGICLFALGLAGNTVPIQRGVKPREQIGKAVGGEALRRLQFITTAGDVTLNALKKEIRFPIKTNSSSDKPRDVDETNYITTEIQVLRLGDIYILGLPGEILVEVGLEIKKRAGVEKLFIISVSNDTIGYVCHSQAYEEGGYEPGSGTNLAKGAGEIMVREALDLLNRITRLLQNRG
ncbi:MAG: neutral/alkaline non-lysosomal ceramidase N-terminal domain-containing protein [Planctomycetota bacterium]